MTEFGEWRDRREKTLAVPSAESGGSGTGFRAWREKVYGTDGSAVWSAETEVPAETDVLPAQRREERLAAMDARDTGVLAAAREQNSGLSTHSSGSFGRTSRRDRAEKLQIEAEELYSRARAAESLADEYAAMRPTLVKPGEMDYTPEEIGAWQQKGFAERQRAAELNTRAREKRQQADRERAWETWGRYADIPAREDYGEKSRYVSTYTPEKEKYDPWTGTYLNTGFGDTLYDYVNGNKLAQERQDLNDLNAGGQGNLYATTHSGWKELPEETVGTFNYLYTTWGPEAAYAFLDQTADKGRTGIEDIALGAMQGSGISSAAAAVMSLADREAARDFQEWIDREAERSAAERPGLYGAGAMGGSLLTMLGIGKGIGAVKGFSGLPALARTMLSGAGTMGSMAALQQAGSAATGEITPGEYLKDIDVSALGGAVGGGISQLGVTALTELGLTGNTLARTVAAGLSGAGFAAGSAGVRELSKYLDYPEGYEPNGKQIVQDALVAFAFASLSYLTGAGTEAPRSGDTEGAYKSRFFDGMTEEDARSEYYALAKRYHPDLHPGDATADAMMGEINADYDRYTAQFHIERGMEAYRTAETTDGPLSETAAETYAQETAYLQELVKSGALAGPEAQEAVQVLSAAGAAVQPGSFRDGGTTVNADPIMPDTALSEDPEIRANQLLEAQLRASLKLDGYRQDAEEPAKWLQALGLVGEEALDGMNPDAQGESEMPLEDVLKQQEVDKQAERDIIENNRSANRARTIRSSDDLSMMTSSPVVSMKSHSEIVDYFMREHGIKVVDFEEKDLLSIKATLSGIDDMCKEFREPSSLIKTITYNYRLKACGRINSDGTVQIGKNGLLDYGTGVHEAAHAIDFARSRSTGIMYSQLIVERARRSLHLKKNSRKYKDLAFLLTLDVNDALNPAELFAYAIESEKGFASNDLSEAIYRLLKEDSV